jgi:outer membrane protein assembly factor BamB
MTLGSKLVLAGQLVVAGDYDLLAFDHLTGTLRWRFSPGDGYGPGMYLGDAAAGLVFTGSPAGRLYAVDGVSGASRWSALVSDDGNTTVFQPASDHNLVAAGYTTFVAPNRGGIVVLDASTGRERWRTAFPVPTNRSLGTGWAGGPVFIDDLIIASSGDGTIYAFSRANGLIRWSIPSVSSALTGRLTEHDFRPLARSGETLLAGSLTGWLVAYSVDTPRERWHYSSPDDGSIAFSITSDEQAVYLPHADGRCVAVDVATGTERGRAGLTGSGFSWLPALAPGRFYFATSTNGFFAFRR